MGRYVGWLALAAACTLCETARAETPPANAAGFRTLSLAESVNAALRKARHRVEARGDQPLLLHAADGASPLESERQVNQLLLNVEVAYWNLYSSWWALHTREQGLRQAYQVFKSIKERREAGRATVADMHQARGQVDLFRAQRLQALDEALEAERQLRNFTGFEDARRLIPADSPTRACRQPDWKTALEEALQQRPELHMARQDRSTQEAVLALAQVGHKLLGLPLPESRLRQLRTDWVRAVETVKDQEQKVQSYLANYYRRLTLNFEQFRANRAQREAFAEQLRVREEMYQAGRDTPDVLLESQRFWADALSCEHLTIAQYNNALAGFDFAKGASLRRHNLVLAGAPSRESPTEDDGPSLPAVMTATER